MDRELSLELLEICCSCMSVPEGVAVLQAWLSLEFSAARCGYGELAWQGMRVLRTAGAQSGRAESGGSPTLWPRPGRKRGKGRTLQRWRLQGCQVLAGSLQKATSGASKKLLGGRQLNRRDLDAGDVVRRRSQADRIFIKTC
jgi:hypothetical protein